MTSELTGNQAERRVQLIEEKAALRKKIDELELQRQQNYEKWRFETNDVKAQEIVTITQELDAQITEQSAKLEALNKTDLL